MPWLDDVQAVLQAWYPGASGGEAIARVLLKQPAWVLADEATSALDIEAEATLYARLQQLAERSGGALLSIAHRPSVTAFHRRVLRLEPRHGSPNEARFRLTESAVAQPS